jgi:hypothetical protein
VIKPTTLAATVLFITALILAGACATTTRLTPGERLVRNKCGACHMRPAPGDRPRANVARVLEEHRRRFTLTDAQTRQILNQLAPARRTPGP